MTDDHYIDYDDLEDMKADDLITLPFDILDDLIAQASDVHETAAYLKDWLRTIKVEKARLTHLANRKKRGEA